MLKLRMVDKNVLDHYTDLPVGEVLRRARMGFGMEIPYASSRLNIRPEHLHAIEENDASRLPGRVYAIGFVRSYADFLQLDSDKIVYLFKSQVIGHTASRDLKFPVPVRESRNPAWWMVAASLGTLAIIGALIWAFSGSEPTVSPELPSAVTMTAPAPIKPTTQDEIVQGDGRISFTATGASSWLEIRDPAAPDKIVFSRVLSDGETYRAPSIPALLISTGNAESISVQLDGKPVDVFEGRQGIIRNLPISDAALSKKIQ